MSTSIEQPNKKQTKNNVVIPICDEEKSISELYSVFHAFMSIIAIYLSYRCNRRFDIASFISAFCCPYLYIIYSVATKGSCGIIPNESRT